MYKLFACLSSVCFAVAALAVAGGSVPAAEAPIKLKAAYFSSDRTTIFHGALKPFVEAVNAEARGDVEIEVYTSGARGQDMTQQAQMVLEGSIDLAFIAPGYWPARFTDDAIIEAPGLFNNVREATLVYTRLAEAGVLAGYENLVTIAAYVTDAEAFHTRLPVNSLKDLKGMKIRANNRMEAEALGKLGMTALIMPINRTQEAIANGTLDGALSPISALFEFGVGRIVTHHYLLYTSGAPLAFVMNRKKFESLPLRDQGILRKYSGAWAAQRFLETYEAANHQLVEQTRSDPGRVVVTPSAADQAAARGVFATVLNDWVAKDPHNQELLRLVKSEIEKLRSAE
jgi:TRAP-type C4-dicarboxylate transport system substrate-binding protein